MAYYDNNERSEKIPYDKEPIIRGNSYKKPKVATANVQAGSKFTSILVGVLIVFNIILGILVFSNINSSNNPSAGNVTINIDQGNSANMSAVYNKANSSTVCVAAGTISNVDISNFYKLNSRGAGVIFEDNKSKGDAYIVTCYHVVQKYPNEIFVLLHNSYVPIKATLVNYSSIYDIAVLKITGSNEYKTSSATPAQIADSSMVVGGEKVLAIGNPQGTGESVTDGIISKPYEVVNINGTYRRVIRISAGINGGNSGGGLFDIEGRLIGIVNAKAVDVPSQDSYIDNIAYAIPSNLAINLANNIIKNNLERPQKALFGFEVGASLDGMSYDIINGKQIAKQKVIVTSVESAVSSAGLKTGDQIIAFTYQGKTVNIISTFSFDDHCFAINKGDKVTLHIVRGGVSISVTITISSTASADLKDWFK